MKKIDLIKKISNKTNQPTNIVEQIYDEFITVFIDELATNYQIGLRDFGLFQLESRQGRSGTFAVNGTVWEVPDRLVVNFKPYAQFLQRANKICDSDFEITNHK
jgi:nucleoid DNA-binding protein